MAVCSTISKDVASLNSPHTSLVALFRLSPHPLPPTQLSIRHRRSRFINYKPLSFRNFGLLPKKKKQYRSSLHPVQPFTNNCTEFERISAAARALKSEAEGERTRYARWDSLTEKIAASSTLAFLLLQLPQIILNIRNLAAGNNAALFAIPWTGMLTGLLGNLSLLSYFTGKREQGATIVQAVGVLSTFSVLVQLVIAGAMSVPIFTATATAVLLGFIVNFLKYNNLLNAELWRLWQEFISIGGVSVLPQVMWTTFEPYVPPSILPGTIFLVLASLMVILGRFEKLPKRMMKLMGGVAAWSATLLFMWGPVAQMWTNYVNPANIKGISVLTIFLAMAGNSLLLPRALFTRDLMWFTGSSWGALMQGWGVLLILYLNKCISGSLFALISGGLVLWLGNMLVMDSKAHSLDSPLSPLAQLFHAFGSS